MKRILNISLVLAALFAVTAVSMTSCSDPSPVSNNGGEDTQAVERRREVLANLGENVILAGYREFDEKAAALRDATEAYADSLEDADRETARQAWREAMEVWQRAELFQLGPAGVMGTVVGGEDLRDQIYSWPIVNPCRVDQEIVEEQYTDTDAFAAEPVNVRGLDALEYLLFQEGPDNQCKPNSSINTDGSWAALTEDDLKQRRAAYARTLGADLTRRSASLVEAWSPDGGNFLQEFARAGEESETYATTQEALNATSDAMFYLDKETKDMKLAGPVGLVDCTEDVCPGERESLWANASVSHIRNNLLGFRSLYFGGSPEDSEARGFDFLLRQQGAEQLADDMGDRISVAIAAADAVEGTMVEALQNDPESVRDLYNAVKAITDLFKSQFFDVLDLEVPKRGEGDND